jgi:hypothetical protein
MGVARVSASDHIAQEGHHQGTLLVLVLEGRSSLNPQDHVDVAAADGRIQGR